MVQNMKPLLPAASTTEAGRAAACAHRRVLWAALRGLRGWFELVYWYAIELSPGVHALNGSTLTWLIPPTACPSR